MGVTVFTSVAVLFPGVRSSTPGGVETLTVFTMVPLVAVTSAVTRISYVVPEASAGSANVPLASSVGVGAATHWPGVGEHTTPVTPIPLATGSERTAPETEDGPLLRTLIV